MAFLRELDVSGETLTLGGVKELGAGGESSLVTTSAILSTLSKALTEFLLQEEEPEPAEDEE